MKVERQREQGGWGEGREKREGEEEGREGERKRELTILSTI